MKEENVNVTAYRIPAILGEGIFLAMTFAGLMLKSDTVLIISASSLAMVYMAASWYFFKAAEFRGWDMALSIPGGMIANIGVLAMLFKAVQWEGAAEMVLIYYLTGALGMMAALIWYLVRRKNKLEYRLSLKLFSRLALFLVVIFLL